MDAPQCIWYVFATLYYSQVAQIYVTLSGLYILGKCCPIPGRTILDFGEAIRRDLGRYKQEENNTLKDMKVQNLILFTLKSAFFSIFNPKFPNF